MIVISLLTDLAGNTPVLNSNLGNYPYARIKTLFFSLCLFSPEIGDLSSKQPNQVNGKACLLACTRVSVFGDPRNPLRQSCLTIPSWWLSKESACVAGDEGLIPGWGRSPGEGDGNPLQCSCLENPMDSGAWKATVHGVAKSWT